MASATVAGLSLSRIVLPFGFFHSVSPDSLVFFGAGLRFSIGHPIKEGGLSPPCWLRSTEALTRKKRIKVSKSRAKINPDFLLVFQKSHAFRDAEL